LSHPSISKPPQEHFKQANIVSPDGFFVEANELTITKRTSGPAMVILVAGPQRDERLLILWSALTISPS
jgi:hypothetical protein